MKKELELYLHIPFCIRKCQYCDFLSGPADEASQKRYVDALCRELEGAQEMAKDYAVTSIYFGGGTPSLLPGEWMEQVMETITKGYQICRDAEISMEANPGTLTAENLFRYRQAGINRISLGCQSADDRELKLLGRIHTWEEFLESYQMVREAGFTNVNVDLMSGLPEQTLERWENSLRKIAELEPEHISAYSLIVEEGTPFAKKELILPDEETERKMYEETAAILQTYGYQQYEISNYAKEGKECQHNIGYWTRKNYLGFGVGSASLFENQRFSNTTDRTYYETWSADPEKIRENQEILDRREQMEEYMILGLRMLDGVGKKEFEEIFGVPIEKPYGNVLEKYRKLNLMELTNERVKLTREGISVSNPILADFLLDE